MKMPPIKLYRVLDHEQRETLCSLADCDSIDCSECALLNRDHNERYLEEQE
jgi:hypothetical protein